MYSIKMAVDKMGNALKGISDSDSGKLFSGTMYRPQEVDNKRNKAYFDTACISRGFQDSGSKDVGF